ncbi:MAG: hypothetical protein LBW85_04745 [Deltaproteobacteria bacterium]|jgi:hypothetical protein|nr:hypothetical protein [Deltaproteobacteria bacterium]
MDEAILNRLLRRYAALCRSKRIFLKPNIPRLKYLDAHSQIAHEAADESSVLMIYDDTFFRNCSNGILIAKEAMYGRGRGGSRFIWDFLNDRNIELNGDGLYIDDTFVMSFRYLKRLERENILSFARDIQALYLGRPVPSLERRRPEAIEHGDPLKGLHPFEALGALDGAGQETGEASAGAGPEVLILEDPDRKP